MSVPAVSKGESRTGARKTVLSKTFSGPLREQAHAFVDEIVETLTGNRGIARSKIAVCGHTHLALRDFSRRR
jgi:hypothetical protein